MEHTAIRVDNSCHRNDVRIGPRLVVQRDGLAIAACSRAPLGERIAHGLKHLRGRFALDVLAVVKRNHHVDVSSTLQRRELWDGARAKRVQDRKALLKSLDDVVTALVRGASKVTVQIDACRMRRQLCKA